MSGVACDSRFVASDFLQAIYDDSKIDSRSVAEVIAEQNDRQGRVNPDNRANPHNRLKRQPFSRPGRAREKGHRVKSVVSPTAAERCVRPVIFASTIFEQW